MELENLQKELDRVKWLESEKAGKDMTGKMEYCFECVHRYIPYSICSVSNETREKCNLCASAFKQMRDAQTRKKK